MATISKTMRALKSKAAGQIELDAAASVPALKPTYVLVKVHAVALNPTDWKSIDRLQDPGFTVGCDYSGTVVAIGEQVTKSLTPGDRVAGFVHGAKATAPDSGAFAEYAAAKGDVQMKMPPHISDEEAATVGIGVSTVGQGLYQSLGLPWPNKPVSDGTFVLIYGGSTATGIFAIQFAKLSGLRVITTCSPKNAEFVKKLGAEEAFDYRDADACGKKIWEYTGDKLKYAFDCISEGSSAKICCDALTSSAGAKYSALLPIAGFPRSDVSYNRTLAYTMIGEETPVGGNVLPAKPEDFEFMKAFLAVAERLLAEGKYKCYPTVKAGGLGGVPDGLNDLRQGRVSGQKLVYRVAETA